MSLPHQDLLKQVETLAAAMRRRLDLKGTDPWAVLEAGKPFLSSRLQAEVEYVQEAQKMATHPKLALQIDNGRIDGAIRRINLQLRKIDIPRQRRLRRFGIAATIMVNLAIVVGLAIGVAVWRGVL